jgi:hypothetical protein
MTRDDLEIFHSMAEQSRKTSVLMSDPQIKAALLRVAGEFDGIADRVAYLIHRPGPTGGPH